MNKHDSVVFILFVMFFVVKGGKLMQHKIGVQEKRITTGGPWPKKFCETKKFERI